MVLPVVGQTLVERCVLISSDVGGVASPDGFRLVELLIRDLLLLDLLRLLGLVLVVNLLDLGLLLILLDLLLIVFNLLRY